jgi:hypothetical protein
MAMKNTIELAGGRSQAGNKRKIMNLALRRTPTLALLLLVAAGRITDGQPTKNGAEATPRIPGAPRLFQLTADNGQAAQLLVTGGDKWSIGILLFRDPWNAKIRIDQKQEFGGRVTSYTTVDGKTSLRYFAGTLFYKQKLPIPVIYDINGKQIAGLGDGGSQERELRRKSRDEFKSLPPDFQAALLNLCLFGLDAGLEPLDIACVTVQSIVTDQPDALKGFNVTVVEDRDENDLRNMQRQMSQN